MLQLELKRAFRNYRFAFVTIVNFIFALIALFYESKTELFMQFEKYKQSEIFNLYISKTKDIDSVMYVWPGALLSFTFNVVLYILPLLCVFPFALSYSKDIKTNYIDKILVKTSKKKYYLSKFIAVFISSGIVGIQFLLFSFIISALFFPIDTVFPTGRYLISNVSVLSNLFYEHTWLYLLIYFVYEFLFWGILSVICLGISCIENNIFMIAIAPFVLYFFINSLTLWILGKWEFSPKEIASLPNLRINTVPLLLCFWLICLLITIPYWVRCFKKDKILED
ncbi:hypothetical protein [Lachnospira multipara]|uniref:ABC-2 family transporter protein n=1 Tax=Lachnospira multipara TaxID=28051 RepID=A0A1H5SY13_9FIRM|nr:hypothetical protein [Lachnospira multipara]SEF54828.1 hypothetical protein SAMN05216537_103168 [Lachnospira multipara]